MSGLSSTGFVAETLNDVLVNLNAAMTAQFGDTVNLQPTSLVGQVVGIISEQLSEIWELAEAVYLSQYVDTATGSSLDNVMALQGITRLAAKQSTVSVTITGLGGTLIPAGTVFSVSGTGDKFQTIADVTIPSAGTTVQANCVSVVFDSIPAPAHTLTVIVTAVNGMTSVDNPLAAVVGRQQETDAQLRARHSEDLVTSEGGTVEAIRAKMLQVAGVIDVLVFDNSTQMSDSGGRPSKSYEVVINGGADSDIDEEIWLTKPAGIATFGTTHHTIVDTQGFTQPVNWSRPTVVPIYLIVNITANGTAPSNLAALALTEFLAYGDTLTMGDPVIVSPHLIAILNSIPGILDVEVLLGTAPNPTTSNNYISAVQEVPTFSSGTTQINVTVVT